MQNSIVILSWLIKQLDWSIKADVLELGLCKDQKRIKYGDYCKFILGKPVKKYDDLYCDFMLRYGQYYLDTARRLNNSYYSRIRRLRKRITRYLSLGQCIWATLTFSDPVLHNTNESTRRKYVQKYLKSISKHYIANIDFGSDDVYLDRNGVERQGTSREHYHALILVDFVNEKWSCGWTKYVRVHKSSDELLLAKYITKLTNHYVKKSTRRNYCIYSRS